ncbi:MAG: DUF1571 domain-containing protein [Planctomycetales bacterium]
MRNGQMQLTDTPAIRRGGRWLASALTLASVCAPLSLEALAKDRPGRKGKDPEVVAKKIDEGARPAGGKTDNLVLEPVLKAARTSRDAVRELPGYSTTFIKQELTPKKGLIRQVMKVKYRRAPFSVYFKFVEPHAGREVLFVEGKNKGKLQVHEATGVVSLAGTLSLSPTGDEAMKENRYPITMFGMEKLLDTLIQQWEQSLAEPDTEVKQFPQAKVGEVECRMFEVTHPKQRGELKFQKTRMFIDKKSGLPIRVEQFGFPPKAGGESPLVEEYTYTEIKAETSLTDKDFDVKNDQYGFK